MYKQIRFVFVARPIPIAAWQRSACGAAALLVVLAVIAGTQFAAAAPFLPDFSTAVFDTSLTINNPYFPLLPGKVFTYRAEPAAGESGDVEDSEIDVLSDTKIVSGVTSRVVRDRVWVASRLVEDTFDWYAQDHAGNVWYMGEYATSFSYNAGGMLTGTSHGGSWEAGVGGAKPGYIMEAFSPTVGHNYYQEQAPGTALDQAEVLTLSDAVTTSLGSFTQVLRTKETTALEPDALEDKLYVLGVGNILGHDIDPQSNKILATTTLISVVPEPSAIALLAACAACFLLIGAEALCGGHHRCRA